MEPWETLALITRCFCEEFSSTTTRNHLLPKFDLKLHKAKVFEIDHGTKLFQKPWIYQVPHFK